LAKEDKFAKRRQTHGLPLHKNASIHLQYFRPNYRIKLHKNARHHKNASIPFNQQNPHKKIQRKKKTLKKSHNGALAPIAGFLPVSVG
jgi:hypothetical protein